MIILRVIFSILLVVIVIAGIIFAVWQLTRPSFANINEELEYMVSDQVESNEQIRSCIVYVTAGDGSFTWSGAAGMAKQDGRVPLATDTPVYLASITKLYTAAAIMRLHEQGLLNINDPMAKYLPDELIRGIHRYKGHDYTQEITIAQLLAHTSGIADYYDEKSKDGTTLFETFAEDQTRTWTVDETITWARRNMVPNFKPGTAASYSDTNYQLLGKIIESVTGKPLPAVYDELFFGPLELKHTWLVGCSEPRAASAAAAADVFCGEMNITRMRANGAYWADGGIVSTAEDAVIFLKALNQGKIIRKDTLALMHDWHPLRNIPFLRYGYGTMYLELPWFVNWIMNVPSAWGHMGSTGAFLYYAEDQDLYIAGTINQTEDKLTSLMLMVKVLQAVGHAKGK